MAIPPAFALISGILAISTGAVFARLADAPSLVIAAYRVGISSLIILLPAWLNQKDEFLNLSSKDIALAVFAGFFLALHFAFWISSLQHTTVSNSVVLVSTSPLWVGLLTPIIAREKIQIRTAAGIGASVAGCAVIGADAFFVDKGTLAGDAMALIGGICAAFYLLLGRKLRKNISLMTYISICYTSSALFLWALVLFLGLRFYGFSGQTTAAFWAMALIPQLIGHTSYNWALKWFSAGTVAVSLLGEPIGATILAFIIFKEKLTWPQAVGGAFILSAIYIAASGENKVE